MIAQLKESILTMAGKLCSYRDQRMVLKFTIAVHAVFERSSNPEIITETFVCLVSEPFEMYRDTDIKSAIKRLQAVGARRRCL